MRVRLLLGIALLALCCRLFSVEAQGQATVIEGGTLIDGNGGAPVPDAVLVIEGETIARISQKGKVPYPAGARVIKADGKFVLPGLWDLHVHYNGWMGQLFVSYGVTSILQYGFDEWIRAQKEGIAKGKIAGPRMFVGSLGAAGTRGFVETAQPWGIPFGNKHFATFGLPERVTADEARTWVRDAVRAGVEAIGEIGPEVADREVLKAIVEEAHQAGIPVAGHLSLSAKDAVFAGVDSLLHLAGVSMSAMDFDETVRRLRVIDPRYDVTEPRFMRVVDPRFLMTFAFVDPAKVDEIIRAMVANKTKIEPDLMTVAQPVHDRRKAYEQEIHELFNDPQLQYVPADNVLMALDYGQGMYRYKTKLTPEEIQLLEKGYRNIQAFIRKFVGAGGTVLAGVDSHASLIPGIGLHYELQLLVDAGLTPMQAIQAATKNAAEWLRQGDRLGTLQEGKIADLVLVSADPLVDIANTKKVEGVMKGGKWMDRGYAFANPIPQPPRGEGHGNPVPQVGALSPTSAVEGSRDVTVTARGNYFLTDSIIEFDGVPLSTTYVSFRELKATLPDYLVARPGTFAVRVFTPAPFGGRSNRAYFLVRFR